MTDTCGALGATCPNGPKGHHKCGERHKRSGGALHAAHTCKYCGGPFT